jgi:glyoxylase-like metal-dependent hydrolase (beta-lactamase superfamily II)
MPDRGSTSWPVTDFYRRTIVKQLFEGVYMLEGEIGGRPLQFVYLKGETASLLMDTGCARDPSKFIVPQINQAGGDVKDLTWILNTHPDLDHICGNHQMKQLAPKAILACSEVDRHICEGFDSLMRYRYDVYRADHQIFYDGDTLAWLRAEGGEPQPIDVTFLGGGHIRLGRDWELELIAVPGHAKGHLAVHDPAHQALYGADAIHGCGYRGLDGAMKLCPTYADVDDYLSTINLIERLPITTYVSCHWPVKRDAEIGEFCRESRNFVDYTERMLMEQLTKPRSLRELCMTLGPMLGEWPRATDMELVYLLNGHLQRMRERQLISARARTAEPRVLEFTRS